MRLSLMLPVRSLRCIVIIKFCSVLLKFANLQHFPLALFARSYRVNDEALLAKTTVWPILIFLMYVFFGIVLKESKPFILVCYIFASSLNSKHRLMIFSDKLRYASDPPPDIYVQI